MAIHGFSPGVRVSVWWGSGCQAGKGYFRDSQNVVISLSVKKLYLHKHYKSLHISLLSSVGQRKMTKL